MSNKKVFSEEKIEYMNDSSIYSQNSHNFYFAPGSFPVNSSTSKVSLSETNFTFNAADEIIIKAGDMQIQLLQGEALYLTDSSDISSYLKISGDDLTTVAENRIKSLNEVASLEVLGSEVNVIGDEFNVNSDQFFINTSSVSYEETTTNINFAGSSSYTFGGSITITNSEPTIQCNSFLFQTTTGINFEEDVTIFSSSGISINSDVDFSMSADGGNKTVNMSSSEFEIRSDDDKIRISSDGSESGGVLEVHSDSNLDDEDYFLEVVVGSSTIGGLQQFSPGSEIAAFIADDGGGFHAAADEDDNTDSLKTNGGLRFVSEAADFAEYFEINRLSSWGRHSDDLHKEILLPEGYIVYVKNNLIQKEPEGTPLAVSQSALLAGNMKEGLRHMLSFCGQLRIFVKGKVYSGDLLIPSGNICIAVKKEDATMSQYIDAIGRAAEDSEDEGLKKVNCLIGIK